MSRTNKHISTKHWDNIIKLSKHKKRSRLERDRLQQQIYRLDPGIDVTGLKNGELNTIIHKLSKGVFYGEG